MPQRRNASRYAETSICLGVVGAGVNNSDARSVARRWHGDVRMILTDLRYSARSLARSRGLTATLLLTIALGIGSNAAVAGFVRGLVTCNLPLPGLEGIVSAFAKDEQNSFGPLSYSEYQSLKTQSDTFDFLGAARESRSAVVVDGRSSILSVAAITPELANLFQLSLRDGVVVSHRVWQDEFGGKADVAGERLRIDDAQQRVAGVAPEWLEGLYVGSAVDIWTSLEAPRGREVDRTGQDFWTFGRLRRGSRSTVRRPQSTRRARTGI